MDVNPAAVETAMLGHGVRRLIHGHTHRPATHQLTVDGQIAKRIVLGDWYEQSSVLRPLAIYLPSLKVLALCDADAGRRQLAYIDGGIVRGGALQSARGNSANRSFHHKGDSV